jgi:hypothetical protein
MQENIWTIWTILLICIIELVGSTDLGKLQADFECSPDNI